MYSDAPSCPGTKVLLKTKVATEEISEEKADLVGYKRGKRKIKKGF